MTRSKPPFERPDAFAASNRAHYDAHGRAAESSRGSGRLVNRYRTALPGMACGIAAVAMAAMTFGLLVVAPATLQPGSEAIRVVPVSQALAMPRSEVVTAAVQQAAAEIRPAVGCDKANRSRPPETRCPQDASAHQPAKSDGRVVGCLDVS